MGTITQTLQSTETYVLQEEKSPNINTLKLLDERRKKVKDLNEKCKQLDRKLKRKIDKEKSSKTKIQKLEEDAKKKDKVMREVQSVKRLKDNRLKSEKAKSSKFYRLNKNLRQENSLLKDQLTSAQIQLASAKKQILNLQAESDNTSLSSLQQKVNDQELSIHYLETLLEDQSEVILFDENERKYTNSTVECVMNLTDLKVPSDKVGKVIQTVGHLYGKKP